MTNQLWPRSQRHDSYSEWYHTPGLELLDSSHCKIINFINRIKSMLDFSNITKSPVVDRRVALVSRIKYQILQLREFHSSFQPYALNHIISIDLITVYITQHTNSLSVRSTCPSVIVTEQERRVSCWHFSI
jgi:hypothetical protein